MASFVLPAHAFETLASVESGVGVAVGGGCDCG